MWSIVFSCFSCRRKVLLYEGIKTFPTLLLKLCFTSSPGKLKYQKCSSFFCCQSESVIVASNSYQKLLQNEDCVTGSQIIQSTCRCILPPLSCPEAILWSSKESQSAPIFCLSVAGHPKEIQCFNVNELLYNCL